MIEYDSVEHLILFLRLSNTYLKNIKKYYFKHYLYEEIDIMMSYKKVNLINIEDLINMYNQTIKCIEALLNLFINIYNKKLSWNITYVKFEIINLKNYYFYPNLELYNVIKNIKYNVIDLYEKILNISKYIPKLESPNLIENKIIQNIKKNINYNY